MNKSYIVKALAKDRDGKLITIWHFHAVVAKTSKQAITECKYTMKSVLGTLDKYIWTAESEWENNLGVN